MFLEDIEKYTSQYQKGMKKITFRSSYLKLLKEPIEIKIDKVYGNYELVFNNNGLLLHSVHNEQNNNFKVIYGYNNKGFLITAMKLFCEKNVLISRSEFKYNNRGKIETETVYKFCLGTNDYKIIECHTHTYEENKRTITVKNYEDEKDTFFCVYLTYNNIGNVIEEKALDIGGLVYWNKKEYDNDNNLLKEISLDENGVQDCLYEFFPLKNNLESGYVCKSAETNYRRDYSFTFNEKNHWINKVIMNDGGPRYFYDREIEYY